MPRQNLITEGALHRLAVQAGIRRLSKKAIGLLRGALESFVVEVGGQAAILASHSRRNTLMRRDAQAALARKGIRVYSDGPVKGLMQHAKFLRLLKQVVPELPNRLSKNAGFALQSGAEGYMLGLLEGCQRIVQAQGMRTLKSKAVMAALQNLRQGGC